MISEQSLRPVVGHLGFVQTWKMSKITVIMQLIKISNLKVISCIGFKLQGKMCFFYLFIVSESAILDFFPKNGIMPGTYLILMHNIMKFLWAISEESLRTYGRTDVRTDGRTRPILIFPSGTPVGNNNGILKCGYLGHIYRDIHERLPIINWMRVLFDARVLDLNY